jgi:SAM-dependent methyltransferase
MKVCLKCDALIISGWECQSCGWSPDIIDGFPLLAPELAKGFDGFSTDAHDHLAGVEENSFWFISRNRLLAYLLDKYFPDIRNMLEIGCGNGFVMAGLAKHRPEVSFHGAEAYLSGLSRAQKRLPKAEFVQMDVRQIPYVEEFDVIGAFDVLEHISEDRFALKQMHKAVKPGGGIMIAVPQHPWLWSIIDEGAGHKRRYTRDGLQKKIEASGFDIEGMFSYITLLLPFMLLSRLGGIGKTGATQKMGATLNGLQLPGIFNSAFTKICDLERAIVKAGFSFPAGGSLVCIAKKREEVNGK